MTLAEIYRREPQIEALLREAGSRRKPGNGVGVADVYCDVKQELRKLTLSFGDAADDVYLLLRSELADRLIERCAPHKVVRARSMR